MPSTSAGRLVKAAILLTSSVEVLVARIASGLGDPIELPEHLGLDVQVLEHRFDDDIGAGEVGVGQRAGLMSAEALLQLGGLSLPFLAELS